MSKLLRGPLAMRKFKPSDLPGLLWELPFDEQSGNAALNRVKNASGYPVANLLPFPENNFSAGTPSADTDPLGGNRGYRWTPVGVADQEYIGAFPAGTYTLSIYARNFSGSAQTLQLRFTGGNSATLNLTTTPSWQRFSMTFTASSTLTYYSVFANGAGDYSLWGLQLERGQLSPYVPTSYDCRGRTPPAAPAFSAAGQSFDGTDDGAFITGPSLTVGTGTFYMVVRQSTTALAAATIFAPVADQGICLYGANGFAFDFPAGRFFNNALLSCREATLADADHVLVMVRSSTDTKMYVDGCMVASFTGLSSPTASASWYVGRGPNNSEQFQGLIGGLYLYNTNHNYQQILQMTRHLVERRVSLGRVVNAMTRIVIFEGDSLSRATSSVSGKGWTKVTMQSLSAGAYPGIQGGNVAQNGTTVGTHSNASRLNTLAAVVSPPGCRRIVTVWFGANDLRSAVSATTFLNNLKSYGAALVGAGYRVVVATVIAETLLDNTVRATANAEIRNAANVGVCWHVVADLAADANIGANGQETNTTYFDADQIHLKDAGYAIAAGIFTTAILTQM